MTIYPNQSKMSETVKEKQMKQWFELMIVCNILGAFIAGYQHNALAITGFAFGTIAYLRLREGL